MEDDVTQIGIPRQELSPGTMLKSGQYRIEAVLGQGGFGITYLAEQTGLGRKVAVKEFFPRDFCNRIVGSTTVSVASVSNASTFDQLKQRFLKEARNIASLDHPNIIRILETFEENDTAYYVTEYIEGLSLRDTIKRFGPVPVPDAKRYIEIIGRAVDYIHRHRMNHLDIKPANIMIRYADNQPILIDFGTSKQYDSSGGQTSSTMVGLTHGYAPIEQYHPGGVAMFSPQTDIYSLGATLYSMLTANVPPHCSEIAGPQSLPLPRSVPQNVARAIHYAMQTHRSNRPDTVDRFLALLGPVPAPAPRTVSKSGRNDFQKERKSSTNPLLIGLLIAILIAITVFIVLIYTGRDSISSEVYDEAPLQETPAEKVPEAEPVQTAEAPAADPVQTAGAPAERYGVAGAAEREILKAPKGTIEGRKAHFYIGNLYEGKQIYNVQMAFIEEDGRIISAIYHSMDFGYNQPMNVSLSGSNVSLNGSDGFSMSLSSAKERDRLIGNAYENGSNMVVRLMPTSNKFN